MAEDILAGLRAKEDEMEALLNEARAASARVREDALRQAREIKDAIARDTAAEIERLLAAEMRSMDEEAARIEEAGEREAAELRLRGERNMEKAVSEIMRFLVEPGGRP